MPGSSTQIRPAKKKPAASFIGHDEIEILVVDDDEDFLAAVEYQVAKIGGSHVSVAHSCDEAVERLGGFPFHLVICDWALASRTGPEVFHLADPLIVNLSAEHRRRIPVMFMSGSEKVASTQGLRSFKYFEPVTFILKSLGPPMIRIMAENILERFDYDRNLEAPCVYLS